MTYLTAARRNDVLRVALPGRVQVASVLARIQEEFVDLLGSAPDCRTVIVELRAVGHLGSDLVRLLQACRKLTERSGRRFRLNGVSQMVARVLSLLEQSSAAENHPCESAPPRRGRPLALQAYQLDV